MSETNTWFAVDKVGLQKLIEHRGKWFAIFELLQNAWDESTKTVSVRLEMLPDRRNRASLTVIDDSPNGFADLRHAYTLFAESAKKADARKRGRFNLGEKLVLALCDEASIISTTGGIVFSADGKRSATRKRTKEGSIFEAVIRMTQAEYAEVQERVKLLLPPADVVTSFNGEILPVLEPASRIEATLPTITSDQDGNLRPTSRATTVDVYNTAPGAVAWLYELGIPVVETDLPFHVSVNQKVPLNQDRDNVTPAYYKKLCTLVANALHEKLDAEAASAPWVASALESEDIESESVRSILTTRFGEKVAVFSPNDPESNAKAVANGYALLHGGQFSKDAWANIRGAEVAPTAATLFPTPQPFYEGGKPVEVIPRDEWTPAMREVASLTQRLGKLLLRKPITVEIVKQLSDGIEAMYGKSRVTFARDNLARGFFEEWQTERGLARVVSLICHELAHEHGAHYEESFYLALERFAGTVTAHALANPGFFKATCEANDAAA